MGSRSVTTRIRSDNYIWPCVLSCLGPLSLVVLLTVFGRKETRYFSGSKGHKAKTWLIENRYTKERAIAANGGQMKILELTPKGLKTLDEDPTSLRHGSSEHKYWIQRLKRHFERLGCKVILEKAIGEGKTVDLEVTGKNGKKIAVEVETGKSDIVGNIKKAV
jgi:hypothetical protein